MYAVYTCSCYVSLLDTVVPGSIRQPSTNKPFGNAQEWLLFDRYVDGTSDLSFIQAGHGGRLLPQLCRVRGLGLCARPVDPPDDDDQRQRQQRGICGISRRQGAAWGKVSLTINRDRWQR